MIQRVKFYSKNDMANYYDLKLIQDKLKELIKEKENYNINEILEFFNIIKFVESEIYLPDWSEEYIRYYKKIPKKLKEIIGKYISKIENTNIIEIFLSVDIMYITDFWEIFDRYSLYKKIQNEKFIELLNNNRDNLYCILKFKSIVRRYSDGLKQFLIESTSSAELLLREYIEEKDYSKGNLFFPESLTLNEKKEILEKYIDNENVNLNYLKLITKGQDLLLSPKIKLKAKIRYEKEIEKYFSNGSSFSYGVSISFSKTQEKSQEYTLSDNDLYLDMCYSLKWIEENLDYPTILNNFLYLFEFTDFQFRFTHIPAKHGLTSLLEFIEIRTRKEYITGTDFEQKQMIINCKMRGYYFILQKNNIYLEKVLEWFFHKYLKEEFQINGFNVNLPSIGLSYLEKCRIIISEIESILKQFKLYVEEKEINRELLEMTSEHLFFKDIPSLLKNKYLYLNSQEYENISYLLFSDQSNLIYIEGINKHYNSFLELVLNEKIKKEMFSDRRVESIDWLIKRKCLFIDKEGFFKFNDNLVWILKELYTNEVLCYNYIKDNKEIRELKDKKIISFESTLLSKPEQNYLNFLLNRSEYSNGLDLRNRYAHGTQPLNELENEYHYFKFLEILVLLVIKINEEFCLNDSINNKNI